MITIHENDVTANCGKEVIQTSPNYWREVRLYTWMENVNSLINNINKRLQKSTQLLRMKYKVRLTVISSTS